MLDRDFDNLRAAHLWSIEHSDIDTALRLVAGLREYSFRCMHARSRSGPMLRSPYPRPVRTIAIPSLLASQPTVGLCEVTSKAPSNSVSVPSPLLINSPSMAPASLNARSAMRGSIGETSNEGPNGSIA